jgi:hypothetical protein
MAKHPDINEFRNPNEPRVPYPGSGGNKTWSTERREKFEEKRAKKKQDEEDQEILRRALKRYKRASEAESDNRKNGLEDLKFKAGDQWPADIAAQRKQDKRPCETINDIPTFVHQVENDLRQNRPSINIAPSGLRSSREIAELLTGMIRAIERHSAAEIAYDTAAISAVDIGFGYWRILTEYESDDSFDQVIVLRRVRNSFTVLLDHERQEPDGCDAKWGFVSELVTREEFRDKWPDAQEVAWSERSIGEEAKLWVTQGELRIAEYFVVDHEMKRLVRLDTGHIGFWDDLDESIKEKISSGSISIEEERESEVQSVMWYKMTSAEILERQSWLGKWIPIIEVLGDEIDIEGKVTRSGIIRNAKGPTRLKNYWETAKAEYVALQPKPPFIGPEGSFDGHENEWKVSNVKSFPYLEFVPVILENGTVAPAPQKQQPPQVPAGYVEAAQSAQQDKMRTTGIRFDASLAERLTDESGKAIHEIRRNTDIGSFHYMDNLKRSLRFCGRQLVDLIPKVYSRPRMASIVNEDGTDQLVKIDTTTQNAVGKVQSGDPAKPPIKVLNPKIGDYEVTVTMGPSYATKRIEAQDQIMKLANTIPAIAPALAPLIAKYSDWPGAQEAYKLLMAMLPPQAQQTQATDLPPAVQAMIQGMQQRITQMMAERQKMLKDLTDQAQDRSIKAADVENHRQKIIRDFEAKMMALLAKENESMRKFNAEDLDRALALVQQAEAANPAGGSPASGGAGGPRLALAQS